MRWKEKHGTETNRDSNNVRDLPEGRTPHDDDIRSSLRIRMGVFNYIF